MTLPSLPKSSRIRLERYFNESAFYINWDSLLRNARVYISEYARMLDSDYKTALGIATVFENQVLEKKNHGVISSLLFLKQAFDAINQIGADSLDLYREAALAIALHNSPIWRPLTTAMTRPIDFFKHPMQYLLMYCDFAQEWGRTVHRGIDVGRRAKLVDVVFKNGSIMASIDNPSASVVDIGRFVGDIKDSWVCQFGTSADQVMFKLNYKGKGIFPL